MAVGHAKSTIITNLDATPKILGQAGKGAQGRLVSVSASIAAPLLATGDIDTTVQLVRIPTNAIVKRVFFASKTQGTGGKFDLGIYKSTGGDGGSGAASSLLAAAAVDQDFFVAAIDAGGASSYINVFPGFSFGYDGVATAAINATPAWTYDDANKELWDAVTTANPGGFYDIVATVTEQLATGGGGLYCEVLYVPGAG